jgi:hypothetical protein
MLLRLITIIVETKNTNTVTVNATNASAARADTLLPWLPFFIYY